VWEGEDECDEDDAGELELEYGCEGEGMDEEGSDDAEEAAALLTSFQRDAGAAAASAAAGACAAPAEQHMGHEDQQQHELWQWMQQQQHWQQLQSQQQAAAQVNAHVAADQQSMHPPQPAAASGGCGVQPDAPGQLMRQLQLGLQRLTGQGKAAATSSAWQRGSSTTSSKSSSSSHIAIAGFGATAEYDRSSSAGAAPLFVATHSSGAGPRVGVGSPSPTSLEAMKKHVVGDQHYLFGLVLQSSCPAYYFQSSSKVRLPSAHIIELNH
jgi:hypothetical protein